MRRNIYQSSPNPRMNETSYPSLAARRRLYAEIVKEYYKEKKAKAKVQAWLNKKQRTKRRTGK